MDSIGVNWIHLDTLGFTWIHLDSLGFTWTHLNKLNLLEPTWTHTELTWIHWDFKRTHSNSLGLMRTSPKLTRTTLLNPKGKGKGGGASLFFHNAHRITRPCVCACHRTEMISRLVSIPKMNGMQKLLHAKSLGCSSLLSSHSTGSCIENADFQTLLGAGFC